MAEFLQQVVSGLSSGGIYAGLALAISLIYRATGVINFAQGEMAMFTTYIAWALTEHHGWSYWPAVAFTLLAAFVGGVAVERLIVRPVQGVSVLAVVIVTLGIFVLLNGLATAIWGGAQQSFPPGRPFPVRSFDVGGVVFSLQDILTVATSLALVACLFGFFRFTKAGLGMRAAAFNPAASRLVGVRVGWMIAGGWGLAAVLGAVAGLLAASSLGSFDPNLMRPVLLYAFAAAVLGGLDSPLGAVVGGLVLGVALNLLGTYVDFIGADLRLPSALAIILVVLLVRPAGLLGRASVGRV